MGTIITFGAPRAGTTFMERMFENNPYVVSLKLSPILRSIEEEGDFIENILERWEKYKSSPIVGDCSVKLGEGTIYHPINSQGAFEHFCNLMPQPITIIRTSRSAENIFKSLMHIGPGINIEPRFRAWDVESICSMLISECAGWIGIRRLFYSASFNFDSLLEEVESFASFLSNTDLSVDGIGYCIKFIEHMHGTTPVREGRLSSKANTPVSENILRKLREVDIIREEMEAYL